MNTMPDQSAGILSTTKHHLAQENQQLWIKYSFLEE
jgi:hypothetical protein